MENEVLHGEVDFTVNFQRFDSFVANGCFNLCLYMFSHVTELKKKIKKR